MGLGVGNLRGIGSGFDSRHPPKAKGLGVGRRIWDAEAASSTLAFPTIVWVVIRNENHEDDEPILSSPANFLNAPNFLKCAL